MALAEAVIPIPVGLPGVLWVLPDSYIDVKNKDYGGQCSAVVLLISACSGTFRCFWLLSSQVVQPLSLFSIHSGDKYINGEIIPCTYPTYQPKERRTSKYESRRYERRRDGPPAASRKPRQQAPQTESASS